jgi:hypothetical protein
VASSRFTLLLMKPASILHCLLLIVSWCASGSTQAGTFKSEALSRSTQMIVVTTSDWNAVEGRLQRYERAAHIAPRMFSMDACFPNETL